MGSSAAASAIGAPGPDCPLCPRLAAYRAANRAANPGWFNAPVPSFGPTDARLLVVGMAPGVKGANRTGRPFTGDFAGMLLYRTLIKFGFARGEYDARVDDGLALEGTRVINAVRCVPPANLPEPVEVRTCNAFLADELAHLTQVRAILALGVLAHGATVRALGLKMSQTKFKHGAFHALADGRWLVDSYHVSRYNTNTGVLTTAMFEAVVEEIASRVRA